jgi:hypothetical protein
VTSGFEGPVAPAIGTRRDTTLRWNAVSELLCGGNAIAATGSAPHPDVAGLQRDGCIRG